MYYKRQHFTNGQVLTAENMNKVDEWLAHICQKEIVSGEVNTVGELELKCKDGETISLGVVGSTNIDVTAKVGQTIIVKTIDANGKPLSWKAVDLPTDEGDPDAVADAIEAALAEAKASGDILTGDDKAEIVQMAAEAVEIPEKLPNPNTLTFKGAVTGSYDGSSAKTVNIPTVPSALKNPEALTINGKIYDGSQAVTVNIEGGGGSGGGDTVYARITYDAETDENTSTMTAAEMMAAYESGCTVVVVVATSGDVIDVREGSSVLAPYGNNTLLADIITETDKYRVLVECTDSSNPENGRIVVQPIRMGAQSLVGTTDEITPSQVAEAVTEGRPVCISHTDKYGSEYQFTSFNVVDNLVIGEMLMTAGYDTSNTQYATFPHLKGILGDNERWFFDETLRMATVEGLPTALPNPNALTINGKVYDGSEPVTVNFEGGIDAEWVATSEIIGNNDIVIAEQTLSSGLWSKGQTKLVPGATYEVYVNDVCYLCVCYSHNDGGVYLGNGSLAGSASTPHNNEPFCILAYSDSATSGTFYRDSNALSYPLKLKVTGHSYVKYNKLPKEYLPDDIGGNIDVTAEVGQTIVVEEVDGSGKPTKWRAADYQPKICECEVVEIQPLTEITPVFDQPLGAPVGMLGNFKLTVGNKYKVKFDGVVYDCECFIASMNEVSAPAIGNYAVAGGENTGEPFAIFRLEEGEDSFTGIIFFDMNPHTVQVFEENIQKIPTKFVPTLEEMYSEEVEILSETTVECGDIEGQLVGMITRDFSLEDGKDYVVKYNGTEYTSKCHYDKNGTDAAWLLGNFGVLMGTGDNGMPFAVLVQDGGDKVIVSFDGSTSVTLSIKRKIYIPIPVQYLGNAFPYYIDLIFEYYDDGGVKGISCAESGNMILELYRSGRNITLKRCFSIDSSIEFWYYHLCRAVTFENGATALVFTNGQVEGSNTLLPTINIIIAADGGEMVIEELYHK